MARFKLRIKIINHNLKKKWIDCQVLNESLDQSQVFTELTSFFCFLFFSLIQTGSNPGSSHNFIPGYKQCLPSMEYQMKFNRLVGFLRDTLPLPCHSSTWHHYLSTLQNIEIEFFFFNSFLLVCLNYLTRGFFLFFFLKKKTDFTFQKHF